MSLQTTSTRTTLLCLMMCALTFGCAKVSLSSSSPSQGHQPINRQRELLPEPTTNSQANTTTSPSGLPPAQNIQLNGHWKIGFKVGNKNLTSTVTLAQQGANFQGDGQDDQSQQTFKVTGTIQNGQVSFSKTYTQGHSQPVQYSGTSTMLKDGECQGPYMTGDYSVTVHGKTMTGPWEAMMGAPQQKEASSAPKPSAAPSTDNKSRHAPELSGKWKMAYEYDFKVIHSTMFLENDGGKITGRGIDENTKEKFVIERGWYKFPKLTIIRKYNRHTGGKSDREYIFKADVSNVNDSDYQGPYLNGKTQGGGTWEAQQVK